MVTRAASENSIKGEIPTVPGQFDLSCQRDNTSVLSLILVHRLRSHRYRTVLISFCFFHFFRLIIIILPVRAEENRKNIIRMSLEVQKPAVRMRFLEALRDLFKLVQTTSRSQRIQ